MTNEEMLRDIQRMNNESIESIKRSMEFFREISISKEYSDMLPENEIIDIKRIMQETLKTAEKNGETVKSILVDNAYNEAMAVIPKT